MALGDLTPQLRTRLFRMERFVGLFVAVAGVLMLMGFLYYLYHTAESRGWFVPSSPYYSFVASANGLKVGDPVLLMGFSVGEITQIEAQPPGQYYNVFVAFVVRQPYYGYIWTDSKARIIPGDLLGGRVLEVTKGVNGKATVYEEAGRVKHVLVGDQKVAVEDAPKGVFLEPLEEPTIAFRAEKLLEGMEKKLPAILGQVETVLASVNSMVTSAGTVAEDARPILANLEQITTQLRNPDGSLGEWLLPPELRNEMGATLASAGTVAEDARPILANIEQITAHLRNPDGSLGEWLLPPELRKEMGATLATLRGNLQELNQTLSNVSAMTGSLREQVEANDRILDEISSLIVETDELVKGLKRTWLLRGAFPSPAPQIEEAIDAPLLTLPRDAAP